MCTDTTKITILCVVFLLKQFTACLCIRNIGSKNWTEDRNVKTGTEENIWNKWPAEWLLLNSLQNVTVCQNVSSWVTYLFSYFSHSLTHSPSHSQDICWNLIYLAHSEKYQWCTCLHLPTCPKNLFIYCENIICTLILYIYELRIYA
jgi:hypothetical protein